MKTLIPALAGLIALTLVWGVVALMAWEGRRNARRYGWYAPAQYVGRCQCGWQSTPTDDELRAEIDAERHADTYQLYGGRLGTMWPHEWTRVVDLYREADTIENNGRALAGLDQ